MNPKYYLEFLAVIPRSEDNTAVLAHWQHLIDCYPPYL